MITNLERVIRKMKRDARKEGKTEVAQIMLQHSKPLQEIQLYTGLSLKELAELREKSL